MSRPVMIIGATSGIGRAIASAYARKGHSLILCGRDETVLKNTARDIEIRFGVSAIPIGLDVLDFSRHEVIMEQAQALTPDSIEGVIMCHGMMPDQRQVFGNAKALRELIDTNFASTVSLSEAVSRLLAPQGGGFICVITSVAADRGRPINHLYGATKAAVTTYLEGLRVRLAADQIAVINIKPGAIDTAMTWGMPGLRLMASAERVARDTIRGIEKNRPVVYSPRIYSIIMTLIRSIPDRIFKKMNF